MDRCTVIRKGHGVERAELRQTYFLGSDVRSGCPRWRTSAEIFIGRGLRHL
jgi:hypothetical protein